MKRPILIASGGAFERSALRRILADAFPAAALRDCASAADLHALLDSAFPGLLILDETQPLSGGTSPALRAALARLGPRLLRLPRDPALTGPPVGAWARDLAGQVNAAIAASALPDLFPGQSAAAPPDPTEASETTASPAGTRPLPECLLVASSTGGPGALASLLRAVPASPLPWIIAQHMPADGTAAFAAHLADVSGRPVHETSGPVRIAPGSIHVLRGGEDFELTRTPAGALALRQAEAVASPFHPNADRLMQSAASTRIPAMALVLSGMGEDGARGACALASAGNPVYVQDPATCVVPGMPGAVLSRLPAATRLDPAAPPTSFLRLCSLRP